MAKNKCMKCNTIPETINGLCLKCHDDWIAEAQVFKNKYKKEAGIDEFYIWVVKPSEWEKINKP